MNERGNAEGTAVDNKRGDIEVTTVGYGRRRIQRLHLWMEGLGVTDK